MVILSLLGMGRGPEIEEGGGSARETQCEELGGDGEGNGAFQSDARFLGEKKQKVGGEKHKLQETAGRMSRCGSVLCEGAWVGAGQRGGLGTCQTLTSCFLLVSSL